MIKHNIIYSSGTDWLFDIQSAEGVYINDSNGKKLLDFTSGWNVKNLGWNNPEIAEALINQIKKNANVSLDTADSAQIALAEKLAASLPQGLEVIGKTTGGTEAVEEALKTARAYTRRQKFIGFRDSYHGQSFAAMTVGYSPEYTEAISPMLPDVIKMDFPNTYRTNLSEKDLLADFSQKLEEILSSEDVAAILTEAGIITGWGTTYIAPDGYLKVVRELTQKYGTLLILDEVGTGFSRTGKLFAMEHENVTPDIITLAKGMSNGVAAIGAMVTTKEIAEKTWEDTNLTATFGWVPVGCAAALKVLEIHNRDKVWEKAQTDGSYILEILRKELENHPNVGDIRGKGMEIGIDFVTDKESKQKNIDFLKKVLNTSLNNGLFLNSDSESNIQLMPPLIINREDLDKGLEILVSAINEV